MPRPRRVYLHVGLDDGSGDVVDAALGHHAHALLDLGVRRAAATGEESFRAALDAVGCHREHGYARDDVAGAWARQARRARKGRDTIVVSAPLLAAADPARAAQVVESFRGFEVHALLTVRAPDLWTPADDPARDLPSVLARWTAAVRRPERTHVLVCDDDPTATWRAVGRTCGFGTASLAVAGLVPVRPALLPPAWGVASGHDRGQRWAELLTGSDVDVVGDPAALARRPADPADPALRPEQQLAAAARALDDARRDTDRLRRRAEELERRLGKADAKRRKLKRRLVEAG
ncbi:hypothetical protein GCM10023340_03000 [Nocardioides marinquilinus]|uniref:DUF3800 domain-containing protein n=1 Tax=Nocardioides marinquilinus TaxID=1210400 RepID=A0ABP9P5Z6_9ACTN